MLSEQFKYLFVCIAIYALHSYLFYCTRGVGLALVLVLINTNSTGAMPRENKMKQKFCNKKDAQGASA